MKNKPKQTAVEHLEIAIYKYMAYCVEGSHKADPFTIHNLLEALEQAKQMIKDQIIQAYTLGHVFHDSNDENAAEFYYKTEYETPNN